MIMNKIGRLKKRCFGLIGFFVFAIILYKANVFEIFNIISGIQLSFLLVAVFFSVPILFVKSWRWSLLLKLQNINCGLIDAFWPYLASTFVGIITPGRAGDFLKVFYLTNGSKVSFGRAFSSVLVDKLLDLTMLFGFCLVGGLIISSMAWQFIFIASLLSCLILLVVWQGKHIVDNLERLVCFIFKKYESKITFQS